MHNHGLFLLTEMSCYTQTRGQYYSTELSEANCLGIAGLQQIHKRHSQRYQALRIAGIECVIYFSIEDATIEISSMALTADIHYLSGV